jgi:hypothetical protein
MLQFGLPKGVVGMFNSSVIDVAIGLVFVFLLLSLIASAAKEILEACFKRRAKDLRKGINELLGSDSPNFISNLYDHGLINSLFRGSYKSANPGNLPSYIPSKNFALALMDLRNTSLSADQKEPKVILPAHVEQAFNAFKIAAGNDAAKMQQLVEDWYNSSMDRVSGWYKRRSQWWVFVIGLVLSVLVNADCVIIARRLSTDTTLREAVVKAAQQELKSNPTLSGATSQTPTTQPAGQPAPATADAKSPGIPSDDSGSKTGPTVDQSIAKIKANLSALDGVGLPIGWGQDLKDWNKETDEISEKTGFVDKVKIYADATWHLRVKTYPHLAGWLLTALAVSLGAPFWFDMLNKIMVVRSTVKPSEKSKEEGSKDPGTPKPASAPTQ